MYLDFYGLKRKPFSIVPNPDLFFPSPKHRMALTYLEYGLEQGDSFVLLTGEIGTGKTTLIKHLLGRLKAQLEVAVIFNTNLNADNLLRMVLQEFEVDTAGDDKSKNLDALNAYLIKNFTHGKRSLLIVDEAQNLSKDALEEVRMLSNLHAGDHTLLQIVLVGQPDLRLRMQDPALAQLAQRISVNYHLGPLSLDETDEYIRHRLREAGRESDELFEVQAVQAVFDHSGGVPRIINTMCDTAMVYGFADGAEHITREIIDSVIKDKEDAFPTVVPAAAVIPADHSRMPAGVGGMLEGTVAPIDPTIYQRISGLEGQVSRLTQLVESQMRELRMEVDHQQLKTIAKLEELLEKERKRNEKLLWTCSKYHKRIAELEAQAAPHATGLPEKDESALPIMDDVAAVTGTADATRKRSLFNMFGRGKGE